MTSLCKALGGIAFAGALAASGTAALADKYSAPAAKGGYVAEAPAQYNWGGLYVGASLGGQWSDVTGRFVLPPPDNHNTNPDTGIYGGHFGIQHQYGRLVVGAEVSVSGTGLFHEWTDGQSLSQSGDCIGSTANRTCQSHVDYIVTIGPRLGVVVHDSVMLFGTVGYASANLRTRTLVTATGVATSNLNERHDGWFIGGGIEWAIKPNLILGVEYQHLEFDSAVHRQVAGAVSDADRNMEFSTDIVRARLSLKLNRPEAAAEGGALK